MGLLQRLGLKKSPFKKTILTDDDLINLNPKLDILYLIRDNCTYWVKERFSKINPSNPKVSIAKVGAEPEDWFLKQCRLYKEVRYLE